VAYRPSLRRLSWLRPNESNACCTVHLWRNQNATRHATLVWASIANYTGGDTGPTTGALGQYKNCVTTVSGYCPRNENCGVGRSRSLVCRLCERNQKDPILSAVSREMSDVAVFGNNLQTTTRRLERVYRTFKPKPISEWTSPTIA
jgi:hypothetical protein